MFNFSDSALLLKQLDFWIEDVIILFSSYVLGFVYFLFLTQKAIIVYEIYRNGAAAKDGRLWLGDKILEVASVHVQMMLII